MPNAAKQISQLFLCIILATFAGGAVALHPVQAAPATSVSAPAGGITVSPTLKDLTLTSGLLEAVTPVMLTNNTGKDITANIRVVDFRATGEFGSITLSRPNLPFAKYGLANWVVLPGGNSVLLPNGQSKEISLHVQNRADLTPGGHYGAVVVTGSQAVNGGGSKVSFKQEIASLLFVKKLGGERFGLQLQSISADRQNDVPKIASLKFKSTGNVYVIPRGYIKVTDPKGKLLAKGIINPESTFVLPETSRQFKTTLQAVSTSKLAGTYKTTAYYRYDGQSQFSAQTISFSRGAHISITLLAITIITGIIGLMLLLKILRSRHS